MGNVVSSVFGVCPVQISLVFLLYSIMNTLSSSQIMHVVLQSINMIYVEHKKFNDAFHSSVMTYMVILPGKKNKSDKYNVNSFMLLKGLQCTCTVMVHNANKTVCIYNLKGTTERLNNKQGRSRRV